MKTWAEDVFRQTDALPAEPLATPVTVRLDTLSALFRLAWWAGGSGGAVPALRLELPTEKAIQVNWERTLMFGHQDGSTLTLGAQSSEERWEPVLQIRRVTSVLGTLPLEGTRLELAVGGDKLMRFVGVVEGGVLKLERVYPPVDSGPLLRALELSRQAEEDEWMVAASEEIAQAAEATIKAIWYIEPGSSPGLQRDGSRLKATEEDGDGRSWQQLFGEHILLHDPEFRRVFELEDRYLELLEEAGDDEHEQLALSFASSFNTRLNIALGIVAGEVVHAGAHTTFRRSALSSARWLHREDVAATDAEFAALGFQPLGDLVADAVPGAILRAYGCREQDCWAVVNSTSKNLFIREFFTHCSEGQCLTTTTLPFAESKPGKQLFRVSLPQAESEALLQAHRAELRQRGWRPAGCPPQLAAVAESVDRYLTRW